MDFCIICNDSSPSQCNDICTSCEKELNTPSVVEDPNPQTNPLTDSFSLSTQAVLYADGVLSTGTGMDAASFQEVGFTPEEAEQVVDLFHDTHNQDRAWNPNGENRDGF